MTEPSRIPYFCHAAIFAALLLALTLPPAAAEATIKQTNFSIPAGATWTGVNSSTATGQCMLLFTYLRTKALVHCTIEGGAPLVNIQLWVDGFDAPVFTTPVSDNGPYTFTVEPLPTVALRAFSSGALRIEGHTATGLETTGIFRRATDAVLFSVHVHADQVVPPSSTSDLALCIVTVVGQPSFLGVDCVHDLSDPQSFTFHSGRLGETGEVSLDFSAVLSDLNPTIWQPFDDALRLTMAADRTYLRMVGSGEGNAIRGQIGGCRTSNSTACAFGRFYVQATGEPTDQSVPRFPASVEKLGASFYSIFVNERQYAKTEVMLFSLTADNDQSLLVEITDGCSSGVGFHLNVAGTDFESYQYVATFTDLLFGYQDVIATGNGRRFDRRPAYYFSCPPQQ